MERLYQPDWSCVFGEKYANAFLYDQIDSLVWPIFEDISKSEKLQKLLQLRNSQEYPLFYTRKISLEDYLVEMSSSNISIGLLNAMNLNDDVGITNNDVMTVIKKDPTHFRSIFSYSLLKGSTKEDPIKELTEFKDNTSIVGIAIYPTYTNLDLLDESNDTLLNVLRYLEEQNLFLKIDIGNLYLKNSNPNSISHQILHSFISRYPNIHVIITGLDHSSDLNQYYSLLKYFNNVWIELEPRNIGGISPKDYFNQIYKIGGFIQNAWDKTLIGSATPTLEISQVYRGFLEATEELSFAKKNILRTWSFRNANRLISDQLTINTGEENIFKKVICISEIHKKINEKSIEIAYDIKLRSYSITQLLYLTDLIKHLFQNIINEFETYDYGEILIRSYHTTTTLIINEHEIGNYLDLHYKFAEISKNDAQHNFHTVRAMENRPDFNRYDHDLATTYGSRQLIIPIIERKLNIGSRENFYILVTFGPRTFKIFLRFNLQKLS